MSTDNIVSQREGGENGVDKIRENGMIINELEKKAQKIEVAKESVPINDIKTGNLKEMGSPQVSQPNADLDSPKKMNLQNASQPLSQPGGKAYQIRKHERLYNQYKRRIDSLRQEYKIDEINQIRYFMMTNKINCFKYNYAFEEVVQNFNSYQSYIQLSSDGTELIITNRKPIEKLEYLHEEDPQVIDEVRYTYLNILEFSWKFRCSNLAHQTSTKFMSLCTPSSICCKLKVA